MSELASGRERENIPDCSKTDPSTLDCSVCGLAIKQANAELCPTHARALDSVRQAYESWAIAYGGIELADFLKRIVKLQGTGRSAREIAEFLRQHPEKWK